MKILKLIEELVIEELNSERTYFSQFDPRFDDTYRKQDSTAERTVSDKSLWGEAGVWRYKIENAGDILRELSKTFDYKYIQEKVEKIENWLKETDYVSIPENLKTLEDFNKTKLRFTNAVDSREYLERYHSDVLDRITKEYENLVVYTPEQKVAKKLILDLLANNKQGVLSGLREIKKMIEIIKRRPFSKPYATNQYLSN